MIGKTRHIRNHQNMLTARHFLEFGVFSFVVGIRWGSSGREFKSRHPDQEKTLLNAGSFKCSELLGNSSLQD
jgi:hypothetical protein